MITLPRNPLRGSGRPDPATRSRRRFARRQWLRRWLVWRYVIGSVLLVALAAGAIWLVFLSSVLTVKHVDVQGESLLSREQILTAAKVPDGAHLADLDLSAIQSRVGALAPVRRVDVSRSWPDGVLIKVTERTAVAAVEVGGTYHAMDADGVLFRDYPRVPAGMPLVVPTIGTGSAALAEAAQVIASLPHGSRGPRRPRPGVRRRPDLAGHARRGPGDLGEFLPVRAEGAGAGPPAAAPRADVRRERPGSAGHQRTVTRDPRGSRRSAPTRRACLRRSGGSGV